MWAVRGEGLAASAASAVGGLGKYWIDDTDRDAWTEMGTKIRHNKK